MTRTLSSAVWSDEYRVPPSLLNTRRAPRREQKGWSHDFVERDGGQAQGMQTGAGEVSRCEMIRIVFRASSVDVRIRLGRRDSQSRDIGGGARRRAPRGNQVALSGMCSL